MTVELHCADCGKNFGPERLVAIPYKTIERFIEGVKALEDKDRRIKALEAELKLVKIDGMVGVRTGDTLSMIPTPPGPTLLTNGPPVRAEADPFEGLLAMPIETVAPEKPAGWRDYGIAPPLQGTLIDAPPKRVQPTFDKADMLKAAPPPPPK